MALYDDNWQAQLQRSMGAQPGVVEGQDLAASGQNVFTGQGSVGDYINLAAAPLAFAGYGLAKASKITPEGLAALMAMNRMVRRSPQPAGPVLPQSARPNNGQAYGPGTYFSNRPAMRDRWYEMGNNVQSFGMSPRGAFDVARSRGFIPESVARDRVAPQQLNELSINSPAIRGLMDEGYIGIRSGAGRTGARRGAADEVNTLFDPSTIPGARFNDVGYLKNYDGLWGPIASPKEITQNVTPGQKAENFVRNIAARAADTPTSEKMTTMNMVDLARARALQNIFNRFGGGGSSSLTPPPS